MKSTILSLVLASVVGLMIGNPGVPVTQEPEDQELLALLTKRRDHLQKYYQVTSSRMGVEKTMAPEMIFRVGEARGLLLQAELDLAASREERIAILERTLTDMRELTDRVTKRGFTPDASFLFESECAKLEIELYKTKKAQ